MSVSAVGAPNLVWVRGTSEGPRVDWKATYIVNAMTMHELRFRPPPKPTTWRVNAKLSSRFKDDFRGKQATHYAFELNEVGQTGDAVYAYAPKGTADGDAMYKALADGAEHNVTVAIVAASRALEANHDATILTAFYGPTFLQTDREIADDAARH